MTDLHNNQHDRALILTKEDVDKILESGKHIPCRYDYIFIPQDIDIDISLFKKIMEPSTHILSHQFGNIYTYNEL